MILRKIPYMNLAVEDNHLKDALLAAAGRVLEHGRIILGPEVETLERRVAGFCGRKFAVGVASGSDALYLAVRCLDLKPGDEIITTPLSWVATANAIILNGAKPVFVDIGSDLNINAGLIERAVTKATKAIIPVHFNGNVCDMEKILEIARRHSLHVIEDAAQAFGSTFKGSHAGSFGFISCFSMNPMKVFPAYGEAGIILTDDKDVFGKLKSLRYAGTVDKVNCEYAGLNSRIDTIQAAMLLVNLDRLNDAIGRRREIAGFYRKELSGMVVCPEEKADCQSNCYTYAVLAESRDALKDYLSSCGIETKIHHPVLIPKQRLYSRITGYRIPVAEEMVTKILSIPNNEKLTNEETGYITACIRRFYRSHNLNDNKLSNSE
ncbi:MAG: DegT/DnrJ/EryC1/StrS family aminotransferase [Deltaproteobacteria bacterium]|nr:DegT/DnrJ/EryC1/StrS family aminotransferase [Deltaproteobacteria bacterium]